MNTRIKIARYLGFATLVSMTFWVLVGALSLLLDLRFSFGSGLIIHTTFTPMLVVGFLRVPIALPAALICVAPLYIAGEAMDRNFAIWKEWYFWLFTLLCAIGFGAILLKYGMKKRTNQSVQTTATSGRF